MKLVGMAVYFLVCGAILAASVDAAEMRVRDLERLCNHAPARCEARILGEIDGLYEGVHFSHGRSFYCLPVHAGPVEKFRVVRKYMHDHPETLSINAGAMVAGALADAYPCPHHKG